MKLPRRFPGKSILTLGRDNGSCRMCGLCCYLQLAVKVEGKQFVPVPFTVEGIPAENRAYLSLQICGSFDRETKKCTDYKNRPETCRSHKCKGKPGPRVLEIVGKPASTIIKP